MNKGSLTGHVVVHSSSTVDMYYGYPNLDGAVFEGCEVEDNGTKKVQLKFRLKNGEDWTVLFLENH